MSGRRQLMIALAGGVQIVPVDGSTGVWIKSGATVISSGMKMTGATVSAGQDQYIYSAGLASACMIASGGVQHVSSGGMASDCTLAGEFFALQGAMVRDMAIISSGSATVSSGAEIYGLTMSGVAANTAKLYVSGGGVVTSASVTFGGYLVPRNAGIVSGVTVNSGGLLYPVFGGSAVDVVIERGGHASAGISGGWISGVTVNSGGYLTVSSGGTALAVTSSAGANVQVVDGGYIEYVTP